MGVGARQPIILQIFYGKLLENEIIGTRGRGSGVPPGSVTDNGSYSNTPYFIIFDMLKSC